MVSGRAWKVRTAAPCSAGAAPRGAGSSRSATKEPFATPSRSSIPHGCGRRTGFPKSVRLLRRSEFRRVYDKGSRLGGPLFAVFYLRREGEGGPRIGFTTPRALGKAVERNRMRRRVREAARLELWRLEAAVDLIFHPRRPVLAAPFEKLRREVEKVFARCGTL